MKNIFTVKSSNLSRERVKKKWFHRNELKNFVQRNLKLEDSSVSKQIDKLLTVLIIPQLKRQHPPTVNNKIRVESLKFGVISIVHKRGLSRLDFPKKKKKERNLQLRNIQLLLINKHPSRWQLLRDTPIKVNAGFSSTGRKKKKRKNRIK